MVFACFSSTRTRQRFSLYELEDRWTAGDKKPLEDVWRAFRAIQQLPADDPDSFFTIGGFHGEPFVDRPEVDALPDVSRFNYWGGWCNHGNILFPTWHRAYILRLEDALIRAVPDLPGLPFWDETSPRALEDGLPWSCTRDEVSIDGQICPNPLKSFTLPVALYNAALQQTSKPAGYTTVRYPFSGLAYSPEQIARSKEINAKVEVQLRRANKTATEVLNENVRKGLKGPISSRGDGQPNGRTGIQAMYRACVETPTYLVFSNTTSSAAWNETTFMQQSSTAELMLMPLETPHNNTHVAIGMPLSLDASQDPFPLASGDMADNNTAGLDPVFFFHHCFVDLVFHAWQLRNFRTKKLDPITFTDYPGQNVNASPLPLMTPGQALSYSTELRPFRKPNSAAFYTSLDMVDCAALGVMYMRSSLDQPPLQLYAPAPNTPVLHVSGINRELYEGSFIVVLFAQLAGERKRAVGYEAVLSRFNVRKCLNCLTHLEAKFSFPLWGLTQAEAERARFTIEVIHKKQAPKQRHELLEWHCFLGGKRVASKVPPSRATSTK